MTVTTKTHRLAVFLPQKVPGLLGVDDRLVHFVVELVSGKKTKA
jgi:hypothetical protein